MTTQYQDDYDLDRIAALLPYKTAKGVMTPEAVEVMVNTNFCIAYGPDFSEKTAAHITIDPLWFYEDLLTRIKAMPNVRFANIRDALANAPENDEIIVSIRHDLDGDLIAARQQAEIENTLGIETSYYLLHTAPYYSIFQDGVYLRNEESIEDYLHIQKLGHELALHTDGLTLYQSHNIDGAEAIRTELAWLRENGCNISGTTAHNSFSVYGCNNYSIFKKRPLAMSTPGGPKGVIHNGNWSPLQMLDEKELGLDYEANEFYWQDQTPLLYGCLMTQNNWYIAENQYGLLSPETKNQRPPLRGYYGTHEDMIDAVAAVKGPAYVKLVVHPMHYGLRHGVDQRPWMSKSPVDEQHNGFHIWAGGGADGEVVSNAITCLNEFDTPDRGMNCYNTADFRIAVLGCENIASHTVSTDSKYSQIAARLIRGPIRKPYATTVSSANDNRDVLTFKADLKTISDAAPPDLILICIPLDDENNMALVEWANELLASNANVLCLLGGRASNAAEAESTAEAIAAKLNCDLINPHSAFAAYNGSARLHWHGSKIWAPQAHAIAGKLLADAIIAKFKPV